MRPKILMVAQRASGDAGSFEGSRGHALHLFEMVPQEERHWCSSDLEDLGG
jgi:hypothetical protein